MFFWLRGLTVVFLVVGVCNTDAAGRVNGLGLLADFWHSYVLFLHW